jgi:TPP-dependent 2-oxoacid decarboxylase
MTAKSDKERSKNIHTLFWVYDKGYQAKHGSKQRYNKYMLKWGMADVLDDLGVERAAEVIEYYFKTGTQHSLEFFFKNYDKLDFAEVQISADRKRRATILEETRRRVEEARNQ